jgi:hypothetical protein
LIALALLAAAWRAGGATTKVAPKAPAPPPVVAPAPAPEQGATIEAVRTLIGKWVETQQLISKERKDWQQGREILAGRIEMVKKEIATIEERMAKARATIEETESRKNELIATNEIFKAGAAQLAADAATLEGQIRNLYPRLPEPLQQRIQPLFQRIPADAAATQVSVAERFQNVLGILNEINKFNAEITVAYEVRELTDGKPSEVKTMYVGLGQAYYVSAGGEAGVGRPAETNWTWTAANSYAHDVQFALEVMQNKEKPRFIPLPVELK